MQRINDEIRRAATLLKESSFAVAFTGAGISTASGIPDFRSPHSGLWSNVDPLAVASIYGFRQNPEAFYKWIRPLAGVTLEARPNQAHLALAALEEKGHLRAVITQNIDMLHTRAGSKTVYELHGHLREATCVHCFAVYPAEPIIMKFLQDGLLPRCQQCNGVIKPNVILFGEQLPFSEFRGAQDAARRADLMVIVGSSLEVAPASDLPMLASRNGAKLIVVNLESTPMDASAQVVVHANAAEVLPEIVTCLEAMA
jgi:NAD-dependent deacetylase